MVVYIRLHDNQRAVHLDRIVFYRGAQVVLAAVALPQHGNLAEALRKIALHLQLLHVVALPGYAHNQIGHRLSGVVGSADYQRAVRLQPRPQPVGLGILRQGIPSPAARLDLHFVGARGLRRIDADFADAQGFDDGVDNLL